MDIYPGVSMDCQRHSKLKLGGMLKKINCRRESSSTPSPVKHLHYITVCPLTIFNVLD